MNIFLKVRGRLNAIKCKENHEKPKDSSVHAADACTCTDREWDLHFRIINIYALGVFEGPGLLWKCVAAGACDENVHSGLSNPNNLLPRCPTAQRRHNLT